MKILLIVVTVSFLIMFSSCQDSASVPDVPIRPLLSQLTYAGSMTLNADVNSLLDDVKSIKHRRERLRKPLMRIYELFKGPDVVRGKTKTVVSLASPLSNSSLDGRPELSEMLMLAGVDVVAVTNRKVATVDGTRITSTIRALEKDKITPIGLRSSDGTPEVRVLELGDVKIAMMGIYVGTDDGSNEIVNIVAQGEYKRFCQDLSTTIEAARAHADLFFVTISWHKGTKRRTRVNWNHSLIDAGVDTVLGEHTGNFEGIEQYRSGIIVHNPGPSFITSGKKRHSFVFRLHLDKEGVKWIEAQPIFVKPKHSRIGKGVSGTHDQVDELVKKSGEYNTIVKNEFGRGIWERSAVQSATK